MQITKLTDEEIVAVSTVINEILKSDDFSQILDTHSLIKIINRRDEIYLIKNSDNLYLSSSRTSDGGKNCKILTGKIKLGFFIQGKFKIGIESLRFLANYCQNPIFLSPRQEKRFIYSKDINLRFDDTKKGLEKYSDGSMVLVFNKKRIPIGYAKILHKQDYLQLKNIIDIGIYLRSEKTAF